MRVLSYTRLLLALALPSFLPAQVVINEVLYRVDPASSDPLKSQQWVELFNNSGGPVDLTGWIVSGRDGSSGSSARNLPSVTLPPQAYLVLHLAPGTDRLDFGDNTGDTYSQDAGPVWSADMDEVALYSPNAIVDFIAWADIAVPYSPGTAHNDAVAAGIWTPSAALQSDGIQADPSEKTRPVLPGSSIGRDADSTDTDSTADFEPHGGVDALDNSPNRQNLDQLPIVEVDPPSPAAARPRPLFGAKQWTVMLYLNGANSLQTYIFRNMFEICENGGSDDNVNFVVMYKGKRLMGGAALRGRLMAADANQSLLIEHAPGEDINIGVQDMGDPSVLQGFINWAKTNYPANHYAIILSAHGDGWKGYGPDETFPGTREKGDFLYMGELRTALAGQHFDLLGFDACLMAGIEVADQVQDYTDYFVASEELIPGAGYPYDTFSLALKNNPGWTGLQLGSNIVQLYASRYQARNRWSLSLTDEKQLSALVAQVDTWSGALRVGAAVFQQRDDPTDNVEVLIKFDRRASQVFGDANYVDLYDLAQRIQRDPNIPDCVKAPIPQILALISGSVVVADQNSPDLANAHGLHIYFPTNRKRTPEFFTDYDLPHTRQSDGSSRYAIYAPNHDQLPLQAADREDGGALDPRSQWPEPPSPNLKFVADTRWSRFLERFYHPVADNHILKGVAPNGDVIQPQAVGGGLCRNPMDEITVPVGSTVFLSGAGSSDADQADFQPPAIPGAPPFPPVPIILPTYYFWDLDAAVGCTSNCIAPFQVPPGSDAGLAANNNMDADRDIADTTWDEKDAGGPAVMRVCDTPRTIVTTLMPWDDDHLQPVHNTLPAATYVHPQTDSHQSIIKCVPLPVTLEVDQPEEDESEQEEEILTGEVKGQPGPTEAAISAVSSERRNLSPRAAGQAPSVPNYPLLISTTAGSPVINASGTTIQPGGSATIYTDLAGTFFLQFKPTAPGPAHITVKVPGGPSQTISFTVGPPVTADNVSVSPPANGQVAVNGTASLGVRVTNHGQPVTGAPVHLESVFDNVKFLNGNSWARGLGTELLTDSSGSAQFNFQGVNAGTEQLILTVGPLGGALNLTVTGTPPSAPTGVGVLSAPDFVDVGQQATITALAVAGSNAFPGAKITFQAVQGNLSFTGSSTPNQVTATTDSNGQAKVAFAANDPTPIQIKVSIAGTPLSATVYIAVRLPSP
ncbi:MAG TPA: clostripain-related cysteine peptidase [Bryobacteraceae bacterium]|nr:clostripain-related cysteine peptidase [Bryobacteraceae bacterium]